MFNPKPVTTHMTNTVSYVSLLSIVTAFILSFRVIDKSMKNFKAFFRWLYVGKNTIDKLHSYCLTCSSLLDVKYNILIIVFVCFVSPQLC